MPPKFNINSRTIVAPVAAFTMAGLLFVYARSSIQAAKRNARKHREADGGQISWHNETLRRHGVLEPPEDQNQIKQLVGVVKDQVKQGMGKGEAVTEEEEKVRARKNARKES